MDALAKLKEIAAKDLGGEAEDYDVGDEKVFSEADPREEHDVRGGRAARDRRSAASSTATSRRRTSIR